MIATTAIAMIVVCSPCFAFVRGFMSFLGPCCLLTWSFLALLGVRRSCLPRVTGECAPTPGGVVAVFVRVTARWSRRLLPMRQRCKARPWPDRNTTLS